MSDRPLPSSFDRERLEEKPWPKIKRRLREEPLVPLDRVLTIGQPVTVPGILATCYAFYRAYKSMKARDSVQLNKMFRARIYAQAFTILAICGGGLYYGEERRQRRELEKALNEKKSQEKRDAWLRELEIRDQEDREWRERHAAIGKAAKKAEAKDLSQAQKKTHENRREQTGEENKTGQAEVGVASSPSEEDPLQEKENRGILEAVKALIRGEK